MSKLISRRTALRGIGTVMALPWLDAMAPAMEILKARTKTSAPPIRMAYVFCPNGAIMDFWTPEKTGKDFELSKTLAPLKKVKDDLIVFSGLDQDNGNAKGDGPGDHARCASVFLTGVHPVKTAGRDIKLGVSVDQVAAQAVGHHTRLRSLELGCERSRNVGNCDSGYSCAYSSNISWANETTPMPLEVNPKHVFDLLFGSRVKEERDQAIAKRALYHRSILDMVRDDAKVLQKQLGQGDQHKLDEYFESIREIERRLDHVAAPSAGSALRPNRIPDDFQEHSRLLFDMLVLAFQSDSTRVSTMMLGRAGSNRSYKEIGVRNGHHEISHHQKDKEKMAKVQKIDQYHCEQFAYFVEKLKSIPEGDGTLLDNCMVLYGSGIADPNAHAHHDLPILVAGKAGGKFETGQHIQYEKFTPLNNLFITMLQTAGIEAETLGDSNGKLKEFVKG